MNRRKIFRGALGAGFALLLAVSGAGCASTVYLHQKPDGTIVKIRRNTCLLDYKAGSMKHNADGFEVTGYESSSGPAVAIVDVAVKAAVQAALEAAKKAK